jgi:indole-3-glycerol phosphate synthase
MCESLSQAIRAQQRQGKLGVIAELKRRRPGGPDLLRGRDCAEIASVYQSAGATALSVVTSPWFGGSIAMLEEVSAANLGLPVLRKDLIQTEQAVRESKRAGASAVLLVLPLLGLERLAAMREAARGEGLEAFVEVATRDEIEAIRSMHDGVIAINNADIRTNEQEGEDVGRSIALIDRSDPRLWVSASRISGPEDVRKLAHAGFDAILIGTRLLLADDLASETGRIVAAGVRERPKNRPIIKVCGVTTEEEVRQLADCSVDYFGLQVHVSSRWAIEPARARQLAAQTDGPCRATLVTRPDYPDALERLIRETGVGAIQLGFSTAVKLVAQLRRAFAREQLTILQEIPYGHGKFLNEDRVDEYLAAGADFILLDKLEKTPADEKVVATIPNESLAEFRRRHAESPILIAGGVSSENARELMAVSGAIGVDVCSSVRRDGVIRRELVSGLIGQLAGGAMKSRGRKRSLADFLRAAAAGNQVVAYLTIGDPPGRFHEVVDEIISAGALTLELGFPSAKPNEGAIIAASHQRALTAGMTTLRAMETLKSITARHPETPLVAVVQWPAIAEPDARDAFLDQLVDAGAAAVLPVGLPHWQLPAFAADAQRHRLQTVLPCIPQTSARLRGLVLRYCTGCVYVARGRMTGGHGEFSGAAEFCAMLAGETDLPLVVGVGVRTASDVADICSTPAKAAAVGSALVECIASGGAAGKFIRQLLAG